MHMTEWIEYKQNQVFSNNLKINKINGQHKGFRYPQPFGHLSSPSPTPTPNIFNNVKLGYTALLGS